MSWSRSGGELPYNARDVDGVLTVSNSRTEDSGLYICTVVSASGERGYGNATVSITQGAGTYPTAKVTPERVTVQEGATVEVRCDATGSPPPLVKWTKLQSTAFTNFEQIGPLLVIRKAQVTDRGVYVCVASNVHGLVQNSTIIEVTSMGIDLSVV